MYDYMKHNGKILSERVVRCFASKDSNDGTIMMKHHDKRNLDKVASTPEHAFIINDDIRGMKIPKKLDRNWYINLAKERLNDFGVIT